MMVDDTIIRSWLHGRPDNTASAYRRDVQGFLAHCAKPLAEVTLDDLQAWHTSMATSALATQARRLAALKSLLTFAHRVGHTAADVGQMLQTKKPPAGASDRILSEAEVNRMVGAETDPRDRAVLRLLYVAGLRASEASALRWRNMARSKKGGEATVLGKGNKLRTVGLTATLWAELAALTPNPKPDSPVIPDRSGGSVNRQVIHRIVKRAARRAGLDAKVSPHWLRHSHASHALDRGAPPHVVQASLGHASLVTTTQYAHVRKGDASSRYLPE
jgi:site-specific recombinase XerD